MSKIVIADSEKPPLTSKERANIIFTIIYIVVFAVTFFGIILFNRAEGLGPALIGVTIAMGVLKLALNDFGEKDLNAWAKEKDVDEKID